LRQNWVGHRFPLPSKAKSRARAYETLRLLAATLDAVRFGVMAISATGEVVACNNAARKLLGVKASGDGAKTQLSHLLASFTDAGITVLDGGGARFRNEDGRTLELQATPLAQGLALVIEDVSVLEERAWDSQIVEAEYESLFRNAVCGIYRDRLDSSPVRCNPALAVLNGYQNEEEYISAVTGSHGQWYVDSERGEEFKRLMREEGRVKDFVSEVYRHRTRERFWITENAWYVRDPDGNPLFIEGTIQDATERVATLSVIERQANFDTLTQLASRFRFFSALSAMKGEAGQRCTLHYIDLDGFKEVNDRLGHMAGDKLLVACADRLMKVAAKGSIVARLGGDEFAILAFGEPDPAQASELASSILRAMAEPVQLSGREVSIGVSIGVAFAAAAANGEDVLRDADIALYQAKSAGRSCFRIYDAELCDGLDRRRAREEEMQTAIGAGQFELRFQPIADMASGEIDTVEALLRWNHPERGLLKPDAFLPDAQDAGLMTELSRWALKQACAQGAALPADVRISVNLSPAHFRSAGIADDVRGALEAGRLEPHRLILEITESALVASENKAEQTLTALRADGVGIALDDFGTSYSSLSYLQRFNFDAVKIDCGYVADILAKPASAAIIRCLTSISNELGIEIIAEGAETEEIARALSDAGCTRAQGYYYGSPKTFADIASDLAVSRLATRLTEARDFGARLAEALRA
jgi:diguanylate cyclase (GGDEF)-like protein/PAS domain S-box-containing protein